MSEAEATDTSSTLSPIDPYTPFLNHPLSSPSSLSVPCPPLHTPNHAAVIVRALLLQVQSLPLPTLIPPSFVLLAIRSVGICGSDCHYFLHGGVASFTLTAPMILGHEVAGEVLAVGADVSGLAVGERVAVEGGIACRRCSSCSSGRYNLCPSMRFFGSARPPQTHGALRRYVVHPASLCYPLPPQLSYAEAAMCEPLSVAIMAARRAQLGPGMRVAVMGAGTIGLLTLLVARAWGASAVLVADVNAARTSKARELGATAVVTLAADGEVEDAVAQCMAEMGGEADVAFDCVGLSSTANVALGVTRAGGVVMCVGLAQSRQALNTGGNVVVREVDMRGIFRYADTYPAAIELLSKRMVDVKPLITHRLQLAKGEGDDWRMDEAVLLDGFDIARSGRDGCIKVMFSL